MNRIMKYGLQDIEYDDGETIKSIVLGDGTTRVTSLVKNDDGLVGVSFSPAPQNKIVGNDIDLDRVGSPVTGLGIHTQVLFDNPDSIDVVIARLEDAKKYLLGVSL